jgi:DNA-binding transcriptional LysR family regulator
LASSHTRELAGILHILTPPVLATHLLSPLLIGFRERYPKIQLDIEVQSFKEPPIEDYDITLLAVDSAFDGDVIARKIVTTETQLVASPAYLKRKGKPKKPEDLTQHDYLRMKAPQLHPRLLNLFQPDDPDHPLKIELNPVLWVNHQDTILRAALNGLGITSMTVQLVAPYLASGELVRVLSPWIAGQFTMYAALPSRKFLPQRTRVFLEYLSEQTRLHVEQAKRPKRKV